MSGQAEAHGGEHASAPAPKAPAQGSGGQSPFEKFQGHAAKAWDKTKSIASSTGHEIDSKLASASQRETVLGRLAKPVYKTIASVRAAVGAALNPIFHPINTLLHPFKYAATVGRAVTAPISAATSIVTGVPGIANSVYKGVIEKPIDALSTGIPSAVSKISSTTASIVSKIPLVGGVLSVPIKVAGKVIEVPTAIVGKVASTTAKILGWPIEKTSQLADTLATPINATDDFMAKHQG